MFVQIKFSPRLITLITFFSIVFPIGVFASQAQAAETFTVDGNMALNTNNNFGRIDGQPRMSIYTRNDSDPDQQFDRINGNRGGTLLKHRSTGNCLNAHYVSDGGLVNVWPCNANDVDQNFVLSDAGNGYVQIKRAGTNKCVDSPTRNNQEKVYLWECVGNANQRWKSSAGSITPPPPVRDNITEQRNPLSQYEVWIVARKPQNSMIPLPNDAGHSWIAVVRRDYTHVTTFRNGRAEKETDIFDKGGWQTDTTYGFWPGSNLTQNKEREDTDKILRGESISSRGYAVRKERISTNRANWIKGGAFREAGCNTYQAVGGTGTSCNCADYATRLWHVLSAKQEDFRIRAVTINLTLDYLVDNINKQNQRGGDFIDGGKTWP
ncbi:RICIN domain-containing protein [uncultured Nostoc sp.]|uniref:RICIN domain-containing protein n=1 Tax=uncultured Nostoc sp. TaxID=340711 RepID=UPI0035CBE1C9